jgi:DNA repair exonuclease SbcCD nuclease subunit
MKVALITDTHFGARGDSQVFDQFFEKFYSKIFFPVLDKLDVQQVVHLGDTFDRRKFISYVTLSSCQRYFFDELEKRDIVVRMIVGNHDTAYKNTLEVNSPSLLVSRYENIQVIKEPQVENLGPLEVLMIPWVCTDNQDKTFDMLKNVSAQLVMGHLDITGFEMYRGQPNLGGYDASLFNRFEAAYSGHFHHRSTKGNITYLGNPYEITWWDYNDPRGFHILDTDTREVKFIENPYRMFHKIEYDDTKQLPIFHHMQIDL